MSGIDPRIALGITPPQFADPMDVAQKRMTLQQLARQGESTDLQLSEQKRQLQEQQQFRDAMRSGVSLADLVKISPAQAFALQKSQAELNKQLLEQEKIRTETNFKKAERLGQLAGSAKDAATAGAAIDAAVAEGLLPAQQAGALRARPWEELAPQFGAFRDAAMSAKDQHAARLADIDNQLKLAEHEAKLPGLVADSQQKQVVAGQYAADGMPLADKQRIEGEAAGRQETARHNTAMEGQGAQRIGLEGQRVGLERQRVNAETGMMNGVMAGIIGGGGQAGTERNEAVLEKIPPAQAAIVKKIANYEIPIPSGFAMKSPYWQNIMAAAAAYDPTFDASQYQVRLSTKRDFATGAAAKNITSFNTAIGHLGDLQKAADGLGNYPIRALNSVRNYTASQYGNPSVKKFEVARNAVADELTRAFRGMGGTGAEVKAWKDSISSADSPEQLKASIRQAVDLLGSRIEALNDQYQRGMGRTADFLTPKSKQILQGLYGSQPEAPATSQGTGKFQKGSNPAGLALP